MKEINNFIKSNDLVLFPGGKFTAGNSSLRGDERIRSAEYNLYVQDIPSRETCQTFLMCDHEVTVKEYMNFVLEVSGQKNLIDLPEYVTYNFVLDGKKIETNLIPSPSFLSGIDNKYLTKEKYEPYPIVGISWIQVNAYIDWLNKQLNAIKSQLALSDESIQFVLPSSLHWEYAAWIYKETFDNPKAKEIIRELRYYPFVGNKLTTNDGLYKANFGQIKTEFGVELKYHSDDNFSETAPIKSYKSYNDLYDMAGNVSEWTSSKNEDNLIKVKGGSYASPPIFMQLGVHQLFKETHQSSEIGFRIAMEVDDELLKYISLK